MELNDGQFQQLTVSRYLTNLVNSCCGNAAVSVSLETANAQVLEEMLTDCLVDKVEVLRK